MTSILKAPIIEPLLEDKRVTSPAWVAFFNRISGEVTRIDVTTTEKLRDVRLPFYKADGSRHDIRMV